MASVYWGLADSISLHDYSLGGGVGVVGGGAGVHRISALSNPGEGEKLFW